MIIFMWNHMPPLLTSSWDQTPKHQSCFPQFFLNFFSFWAVENENTFLTDPKQSYFFSLHTEKEIICRFVIHFLGVCSHELIISHTYLLGHSQCGLNLEVEHNLFDKLKVWLFKYWDLLWNISLVDISHEVLRID
jgi:hypothetical protein